MLKYYYMKNYKLIISDPDVCHGKPTSRGTRIMVWQILELLEARQSSQEIHRAYPSLPKGSVEIVLHFAAEKLKHSSYASTSSF